MKWIALISIFTCLSVGCSDEAGGGEMVIKRKADGTISARGYEKGDGIQTGRWTYWYADGTLRGKGRFVDGVKHGSWEWFDFNGTKLSKGDYDDGQKSGKWVVWHGDERGGGRYVNGNKSGVWIEWDETYFGDFREQGEYVNGLKDGLWIAWYPNGNKKSEESYLDGASHGMLRRWHENGQISFINIDVRSPNRIFEEWFSNGRKRIESEVLDDGRERRYVWNEDGSWNFKESGIYGRGDERGGVPRLRGALRKVEEVARQRQSKRFPAEAYQD